VRKILRLYSLSGAAALLLAAPAAAPQQPQLEARVLQLACAGGGCPLLQGAPQTADMHSA
jgi:hypothetical protein